ncbi:MAG: hypothetical protein F4X44_07495 [Gammaproteobacteria bacterium]|nr:hypothetical protein [Gammaproteobacteria bacterium]MYD80441.1 hypothetical protein [Gammaproteobacteria bacterium]
MTLAEDLRILGRMSYRQVGIVLLSGLVMWWLTSAVVTFVAHTLWMLWRNAEPESLAHSAMVAFYVTSLAEPVKAVVSLFVGLWVGYLTFSRFKKTIV